MNNNIKFDPMTGEPIQANNQQSINPTAPSVEQQVNTQPVVEQPNNNEQMGTQNTVVPQSQVNTSQEAEIQNQLQSIPTVDQEKEKFINNVQSINQEKKEEKKEGINFIFIIVLFVIILAAIYFLFPLLLNYI